MNRPLVVSGFFGVVSVLTLLSCTDSTGPNTPAVATISVSMARSAFRVGDSVQAAALPLDSLGGVLTGRTIVWSSSNSGVATVTPGGLVAGLAPGSAIIKADAEGKSGTATVQVSLVPVATITVTPTVDSVSAGATLKFTALLKDSVGRVLTGRVITWTSASPNIANVSDSGVVTGILVGTSDIVATSEGKQAHATISVNTRNTAVVKVTITPANPTMSGGGTRQLTATLRDANDNVISGRTVTWSSSNSGIASVSSTGLVTASPVDGSVVITASAEGKSATQSIAITTFVRLSSGGGFACGLTTDGTAFCWGLNDHGQLGNGTTLTSMTPTKVSTGVKFASINAGYNHVCALTGTGSAWCWGADQYRQAGSFPATNTQTIPSEVAGGLGFVSIAPGNGNTCGTTSNADVYCWGFIAATDPFGDGLTYAVTENPLKIGSGMVSVVSGMDQKYCSIDQAGLAYCWQLLYFYPNVGQVVPPIGAPVSTSIAFTTLRRGIDHTCGIATSGQTYCWGKNNLGQLGDGTTIDRVAPTLVAGGLAFEAIAAGGSDIPDDIAQVSIIAGFSCGLVAGGKAYCWGANIDGQLGIGSKSSSATTTPQAVLGGTSFTGIRAGSNFICGLGVGGAGYCWGGNTNGQFGDGTASSSSKPTQIFGN